MANGYELEDRDDVSTMQLDDDNLMSAENIYRMLGLEALDEQ